MPELLSRHESFDDVEALVQRAKDYVRPSEDLRPRVLETARSQCRDRQVRGYLRNAAIVLVILGVFAAGLRERLEALQDHGTGLLAVIASGVLAVPAESTEPSVDAAWNMVDSFTELRRRQAELLRGTRAAPTKGVDLTRKVFFATS